MSATEDATNADGKRGREPEEAVEGSEEPQSKQAKTEPAAEDTAPQEVSTETTNGAKEDDKESPVSNEPAPAVEEGADAKPSDDGKPADDAKASPENNDNNVEAAATQEDAPPAEPVADPAAAVPAPAVAATVSAANAQIEEKGEVSPLYVGRVIGKGGEMIRDLQARSGCRIDVDQNVPPNHPRVISYQGTREKVEFAKELVRLLCRENGSDIDLPLGDARRESLMVPSQSVGKIIGRGGEMIRELQSRSHAKIQVDHSNQSGHDSSQKQVTITGTEQSVVKAKEMVMFLVANPMMDAMQAINMLVDDKLHRNGVWGSGPPYHNLPSMGQNMQPEPPMQSHGSYGQQGGGGGYGGNPYGHQSSSPYSAPQAQPYQQQGDRRNFGGGGGAAGMQSELFLAAKNFMGRIIGQKGVTINDLQRRSGCDIQINQDVMPGQDCEINIRGTLQGIEMAKQMLHEIIQSGPSHPYAGGTATGAQPYGGGGGGGRQQGYQQQPFQGYGGQANAGAYGQGQAPVYQQQQPPQANQYGAPSPYQAPQANYNYNAPAATYGGNAYMPAQAQPQVHAPPQAAPEWKSAASRDGQIYYYNERTGATQWEKPAGMP